MLKWSLRVFALLILLIGVLLVVGYIRSDNVCPTASTISGETILAAVQCEYGGPEDIDIATLAKPVPQANEILIKVQAASVNPLDWHYLRGIPYLFRLSAGLKKPNDIMVGVDYSGIVEAVGEDVIRFSPGDEVFGGESGAFSQYLVVSSDRAMARKPANAPHSWAAAMPIAAVTALQAIRDIAKLQAGQKVLINGASGGVGTYAIQLAKNLGVEVTGVSSGRNRELVLSLGADHHIDYTKQDFVDSAKKYDAVIDLVGNRSLSEIRSVMTESGICILLGGGSPEDGRWIGPLVTPIKAILYSPFVSQTFVTMLAHSNSNDFEILAAIMESGQLKSVIDKEYPLAQTADALHYIETGRARGKVIINPQQ
ncbi:MAG: NAD(P)-dependent alcohol dehydrogenase [Pseudomonadales bacterium]